MFCYLSYPLLLLIQITKIDNSTFPSCHNQVSKKDEGSVQNSDYFYLEIIMIDKMNKCNPTIEIDTSFGTKLGFS